MAYNQVRTKKYDLSFLFVGEFSWIWLNIGRGDRIERPEFVVFCLFEDFDGHCAWLGMYIVSK